METQLSNNRTILECKSGINLELNNSVLLIIELY